MVSVLTRGSRSIYRGAVDGAQQASGIVVTRHLLTDDLAIPAKLERSSEHYLSGVEPLSQPLGSITSDAAQAGHREEGLVPKPASFALARKVPADGFDLPADFRLCQGHEKTWIAEIAVIFWNFVLE